MGLLDLRIYFFWTNVLNYLSIVVLGLCFYLIPGKNFVIYFPDTIHALIRVSFCITFFFEVIWTCEIWWETLPHFFQTWLRNYTSGTLVYFITSLLWCFYVYYYKPNVYVPKEAIPSRKAMLLQMYVAMKAMPIYTALPTVSEYMIENGWTRCFARISDVGWFSYTLYLCIYLVLVEFGIYWMHRELHDIKPLYKYLHATHHIYNKQNTLSPFAGLAFHPIDGILQAVPHVIALFLVPTHFSTHIALLFIEAIWTANIHDCVDGKIWPVMGAGYHTIHHTTYRHNYGHYTVWMDWMFGTLRDPSEEETKKM